MIPAGTTLYILVAIILEYEMIQMIAIHEPDQLVENVYVFIHNNLIQAAKMISNPLAPKFVTTN